MANFQTHLSVGIIFGIICAVTAAFFGVISGWTILTLSAFAMAIGSILPDIDSDSSTPFKIVFYIMSIVAASIAIFWILQKYPNQLLLLFSVPLEVFFFVRFVVGMIFKKFTHHRGIFHSIPMAIVATLSTALFLQIFEISDDNRIIISITVGIGFIIHLILDEIYAAVNFNSKKFHPNKNLGSALKFWSHSLPVTLLAYFVIFILFLAL